MGWLLDIYMLENLSMIVILKFFRIGVIHSSEEKILGIIIGIWKIDIRLTSGILKLPEIDMKGAGDA